MTVELVLHVEDRKCERCVELEEQLAKLKQGLVNNNTDFEMAFLEAYLDNFREVREALANAYYFLQRSGLEGHEFTQVMQQLAYQTRLPGATRP